MGPAQAKPSGVRLKKGVDALGGMELEPGKRSGIKFSTSTIDLSKILGAIILYFREICDLDPGTILGYQ